MLNRLSHTRLLRYAGLFTWAIVGLPLLYSWLGPQLGSGAEEEVILPPMPWQGWVAYFGFGIAYAWLTRSLGVRRRSPADYVLLVLLTHSRVGGQLFQRLRPGQRAADGGRLRAAVVAPLSLGGWVVLASQLAVAPVFMRWLDFPLFDALMQSMLYAGISGFVFITSLVALQQSQAREEQRRLNAELRATRALLAESARSASAPASRGSCTTCWATT